MRLRVTLSLPSEARSVPLVRKTICHALELLGVADDCVADIELAISEACTNVLDHAADGEYEVSAGVDADGCVVEVVDAGGGFTRPPRHAERGELLDADAESGRGLQVMAALVDRLDFIEPADSAGTTVRMRKQLVYA